MSSDDAESVGGVVQDASGAGAPTPWLFAPGQLLAGRYRVCAFIARGGMGEVYDAFDERLGVAIAVKALLPVGDAIRRERHLARELVLARKVTHPGVCRVFDVDYERSVAGGEPVPFVTMELLRGQTLAQHLLGAGPLPLAGVLRFVEQLAAALDAAHAAGVVHRDLKPGNVIIAEGNPPRVVITDFGLARPVASAQGARVATTHHFVGTPAYMAPEQALDKPATTATDIYALGVMTFEMVTGTRPFDGPTPIATALARVHAPAPRASSRLPGLDRRWDLAIALCLSRDPANRFKRAGDLVAALRAEPPRPRAPLRQETPRRRWPTWKRSRASAVGGAAAAVVGVAAIAAMLTPSPAPSAPAADGPPGEITTFSRYAQVGMRAVFGSTHDQAVHGIAIAPSGAIFVVGHTYGPLALGGKSAASPEGIKRAFIARLEADRRVAWIRTTGGTGAADASADGVTVIGDRVLVAGTQHGGLAIDRVSLARHTSGCFVLALSMTDGKAQWVDACGAHPAAETAIVADRDRAYVASSGGGRLEVAAYALDGQRRWRVEAPPGETIHQLRLAVGDDTLALGATADHTVYVDPDRQVRGQYRYETILKSLAAATGELRWEKRAIAERPDAVIGVAVEGGDRVTMICSYERTSAFTQEPGPGVAITMYRYDSTPERSGSIARGRGTWAPLAVNGDRWVLAGTVQGSMEFFPYDRQVLNGMIVASGRGRYEHVQFGEGDNATISAVALAGRYMLIGGSFDRWLHVGNGAPAEAPGVRGFLVDVDGPWWDR